MVRIAIAEQLGSLGANATALDNKQTQCQGQVDNIYQLLEGGSELNSAAYNACFSYITEIKVPVLMQASVSMSSLKEDIQSDISRLNALPADESGVIDTDIIDSNILSLKQQINNLNRFLELNSVLLPPLAALSTRAICMGKVLMLQKLEEKRDEALRYAFDSSIYTNSIQQSASFKQAVASLGEVFFNEETGMFDISKVKDLSWRTNEMMEKYWEGYNQKIIDTYFTQVEVLGHVLYKPTEELEGIIGKLIALAGSNFSDISSIWDEFSYKEKYALLFLVTHIADVVYDAEFVTTSAAGAILGTPHSAFEGLTGINILDGLGGMASPLFEGYAEFGLWTSLFAHMGAHGGITGSDRPGTLQAGAGFMDMYDIASAMLGMGIDTHVVVFQSGGKEHRIQVWDGGYMSGLMHGGEFGWYSRDITPGMQPYIPGQPLEAAELRERIRSMSPQQVESYFINYRSVPEGEQFSSILEVYSNDGRLITSNDTQNYAAHGDHYWNFHITESPNPVYSGDGLYTQTDVIIADETLRADARAALENAGYRVDDYNDGEGLSIDWRN